MSRQWIRKLGLTVVSGDKALDLSQLQVRFETSQIDMEGGYPPSARIRVYNASADTARKVQDEYQRVILQAGYQGDQYGVIFDGTIKWVRRAMIDSTTSVLDISAADGDLSRYAILNKSLAAGWTANDVANAAKEKLKENGIGFDATQLTGGITTGIRGKVLWGLTYSVLDQSGKTSNGTWSIIDGKMTFTPLTGYQPGEAVVLNSDSGLVGFPESTIEGIHVTCLINPKIKLGGRVQIANKDINQTTVKEPGYPRFGDRPYFASVTEDGFYRVLVCEHVGDTRGQEWYTNMVCLALDPSGSPSEAVSAYGYAGVPAKASGTGGIGHA